MSVRKLASLFNTTPHTVRKDLRSIGIDTMKRSRTRSLDAKERRQELRDRYDEIVVQRGRWGAVTRLAEETGLTRQRISQIVADS